MPLKKFNTKEISWLSFNERVLQEAGRKQVPLIERLKFLGIYSNNLDEFFRVRVAILKRLSLIENHENYDGTSPSETLKEIQRIVLKQSIKFSAVYEDILKDLEKENIFLINESQLTPNQATYVRQYFVKHVRSRLMPVIITSDRLLPDLQDDAIYLAIQLKSAAKKRDTYALVEIPSNHLGRFVILPHEGDKQYIILLEDVIRIELKDVFYMFDFDQIHAWVIKLTRDAELDLNDDVSENYVAKIAQGLEKRKDAHPIRFVYDKEIPRSFLDMLLRKLKFSKDDAIIEGGRIHNFKDFMNFPDMGKPHLIYPSHQPIVHPDIRYGISIFATLKKQDLLLHFPYHSFQNFIDILREASIDPLVREIKITIYRVARQSSVMNALLNASRNGKKVTAILELQARFDEKANIKWSNRLRDEGIRVIYGVPGLKVHSKLLQITRNERGKNINYVGIGTGNFNEDTARIFSDHLLLTRNQAIAKEVSWVFDFFDKNFKVQPYRNLLVSPFQLRNRLIALIQNEIKNARNGKKAFIYLKLNNLVDYEMIQKLYQAYSEGVDIKLNIRGMLSLLPSVDPQKPPIPAIAIIDQFLEHSRLYIFGNNGDEKIYISSADLMTRNLDRRIEVACPVLEKKLKNQLLQMWEIQWEDNMSTRILDNEMQNNMRDFDPDNPVRSQEKFYSYLKKLSIM